MIDREIDDFFSKLQSAYFSRDSQLQEQYARSLPFQDAMFDRWERSHRLGFEKGASVYNSALVFGDVRVGENTWIGPNTILDGGTSGLTIGSWCAISAGVQIYTHHNVRRFLSGGLQPSFNAPVNIGSCCFIGGLSIIDPGVSIGNHCLIACNSFVNANVESCSIVAGSPARKIGEVELDKINVRLHFDKSHQDK